MELSKHVENIEISGIRKFSAKVQNYPDAISLTLGQPDFQVPEIIKSAMINAINEGKTTYTANAGLIQLRNEISDYLSGMDIHYDKDEICITVGGSEAIFSVFTAILNPEDVVLIPTPAYPAYESCVNIAGGKVINYYLDSEFNIDFEDLKDKLNNYNAKALVLSFPSNPTGAVLSEKSKKKLFDILNDKNIIIISDEIYCSLCYEDEYYSFAQYKEMKNKVILVGGFSKMFSMTGLRIGFVCSDDTYMRQIMKVHQYGVSCAPSIAQYGALEGLRRCMKDVEEMKEKFQIRRDFAYDKLQKLGMDCFMPKGAFYIFPSIKKYGLSSEEFCTRLLAEAKVAVVPGSAFGKGGEGYIRISYSYSYEELEEAFNRMNKWIKKLSE